LKHDNESEPSRLIPLNLTENLEHLNVFICEHKKSLKSILLSHQQTIHAAFDSGIQL